MKVVVERLETILVEKIKRAREKDEKVVKVVKEIKRAGIKVLRRDKQKIEGELLLKERKVYMLKDEELRLEVIQLHHNILVAGYEEKWKTIKLVIRNYWQPGVTKDIGRYIEGCDLCQGIKNRTKISVENLITSKILKKL